MKPRIGAMPGSIAAVAALGMLLISSCPAEEISGYNGAQLYQRFCASCHGARGHGDGPVASSIKSMVPDLRQITRRHGGVFPAEQLERIIDGRAVQPPHGTREMPVWGYEFRRAGASDAAGPQSADDLVSRLVDYLRSIQSK
jgi:mono/diheme cytochrome c family protein